VKIIYLVHQFFPEYYTGTEKFVYNLAAMMQHFGNQVKVVTYSFYEKSSYNEKIGDIYKKEFTYHNIPIVAFQCQSKPIHFDYSLDSTICEDVHDFAHDFFNKEKPDIIHVGHPMRIYEFIHVAKEMGIPYVMTLTDFALMCPKVNLTPTWNSLCPGPQKGNNCVKKCSDFNLHFIQERLEIADYMLKNAKRVVSPSHFLANLFKNEFNELNIKIIPHGLKNNNIKKNNRNYKKGDSVTFGYAGTVSFHKGLHVLLKAFSQIKNHSIKLKIYGSGPDLNYTKNIKELSCKDSRIDLCGTFNEQQIGDVFSSMDVLIVPSLCYENYPLILHEALACNIPVVASNMGGMREKIQEWFNGFTFAGGDYMDLKTKLELIANHPEILNFLKKNIMKDMVIPRIEQEAYEYLDIYKYK
jgi:glycosyltransferase involved in cell wall biosynthesis